MSLIDLLPTLHNSPAVPHNSVQPEILRLNIAFITVTSCFIIARVLVRTSLVKHFAIEDYLMVAAGVFATSFSTMAIVGMEIPIFQSLNRTNSYSKVRDGASVFTYGMCLKITSLETSRW
jgi:hypothetical protein